ncbi:MAG TPA: cystathionine beta-synthase [Chloroflexota bacterium]|nr:cystathionine beta-synthase [Chloroflexota bacterium]
MPAEILETILDAVGNTPLVRLSRLASETRTQVVAKVESLNPGGSIKDRIGLAMIEAAEHAGQLHPGATIVEPTSGNTGTGLAIAAALKGYRLVCVMPDKMSSEKIALLRAYGADVVVCPTAVPRESPQSYYSVADRLAREIPGAFQPNQYFNPANTAAHEATTGPEIWRQTDGQITHFVAGMGTGGTITGVGRVLKRHNPAIQVVGADPVGSIYSAGANFTPKIYKVEGIGEDFMPSTMDLSLVDRVEVVDDKESFLMARRLTREEGILIGGSGGSALVAAMRVAEEIDDPQALIVVLLPDTGRNYLSKIFNEEWMRSNGFLEQFPTHSVGEMVGQRVSGSGLPPFVGVQARDTVRAAIDAMQHYGISQLPVVESNGGGTDTRMVGSIQERTLLDRVYRDPSLIESSVGAAMDPPFPTIARTADMDEAFDLLLGGAPALVITERDQPVGMITKLDLLEFVAQHNRRRHPHR